ATGTDLLDDYLQAKGDETYAGMPQMKMMATSGIVLEGGVFGVQPLVFDSSAISNERWPYTDGGFPSAPQESPTWYAAWAAFQRGDQLALPYFAPRTADPTKQAALTTAYQQYRAGT